MVKALSLKLHNPNVSYFFCNCHDGVTTKSIIVPGSHTHQHCSLLFWAEECQGNPGQTYTFSSFTDSTGFHIECQLKKFNLHSNVDKWQARNLTSTERAQLKIFIWQFQIWSSDYIATCHAKMCWRIRTRCLLNGVIIPESFLKTRMFHSMGVCISDLVAHLVLPNGRCQRLALQNLSSIIAGSSTTVVL